MKALDVMEKYSSPLKVAELSTPLGTMIAIGNENGLYLLEFSDWIGLDREVGRLQAKTKAKITSGTPLSIISIRTELKSYFDGSLREFKTPVCFEGSAFQCQAWGALMAIPYGQTKSYSQQAAAISNPLACRAVANANARNKIVIVVPCHRIINNNGKTGGYGGGIFRKIWLLNHEGKKL